MRKGFLILLVLLIPWSLVWSLDGAIFLEEKHTEITEYAPGSVVVRPVIIGYEGRETAEVSSLVELPESWRLLSGEEEVTFSEAGTHLLLVSFYLPENTGAGEYSVTLILRDGETDMSRLDLAVRVLPQPELSCMLLEQPDYILAGAAYQVVFGCSNTGNVPLTAVTEAFSSAGFDLRTETSRLALLPGETVRLAVIVDTPINLYTQIRHIMRLAIYSEDDETVKASSASLVEIIPRTTGRESRYNIILGEVHTTGVLQHSEESDLFGLEAEISGQGFLDEENETFLFFRVKEPLAGIGTLIQDRDDYLLRVGGRGYSAGIGKQFFNLSPLTEASIQGTGVSVKAEHGPMALEGFAMDNLLDLQPESRFGTRMSYRLGDQGVAALNLLQGDEDTRWTCGSLEGHFLLPSGNRFELEYASSDAAVTADNAFYSNIGGSSDNLSYHVKYLRAGPRYRGAVEDVEQIIASLSYTPVRSIRLRTLLGRKDYNIDRDIPNSLRSGQFGVTWTGFGNSLFMADVRQTRANGNLGFLTDVTSGETYRLGIIQDTPAADFKLTYEFGSLRDMNTSSLSFSEKITMRMDVSSSFLGDLWTSVGYCFRNHDDTRSPYSDIMLSWNKDINGRVGLSTLYRTVNSHRSYYLGSDSLTLALKAAFPNQSEISVSAEYGPDRRNGNPEDLKITVAYYSPFPIPVSVKNNIGKVEGKVTDALTGKAVPDVVLRLGDAVAATDPFGHYSFHSLVPGTHRMYIDPASLPADYVVEGTVPLEIEVSDTTAERNIRITRASSITGRVVLFRFDRNYSWLEGDKGAAYVDPTGMPGVLLSAEGPEGRRRALTGDDGNFAFPPLRPGDWTLRVPEEALPEGHFYAKGEFELVLEPGQKEDVIIKIFPRVRQIRFIDEGTVIEETIPEESQPETEE